MQRYDFFWINEFLTQNNATVKPTADGALRR